MQGLTMLQMVEKFPDQLVEALNIGKNAVVQKHTIEIHQVLVSGMGGSGIGGDFVQNFVIDSMKVPYIINKKYDSPNWINEHTVFIASSYSGNTEETISSMQQALLHNPKLICISSGGKILQFAKENNSDYIAVPANWSSPRACLAYSLVAQLYALHKLDLIGDSFVSQINNTIIRCQQEKEEIKTKAQHIANALANKTVVIYGVDKIEPVCVRFRQQINENAKRLCWHHVIPEMNHNELVGWRKNDENLAVIFLRNNDDYSRNMLRMDITKEIVSNYAGSTIEVYSKGDSLIERSLYLVHLLDYVSVFLADINQHDAVEVKVIDFLKNELSKV